MKNIHSCIFVILTMTCLQGQNSHTVQQLLENAVTIDDSASIHGLLQQAQNKSGTVEKMEFRTETNQWDLERQEYSFRTSLRGKSEAAAEQKIWSVWQELIAIEDQQYFVDNIYDRYEAIVAVIYATKKLDLYEQILAVLYDKDAVFHQDAKMGGDPKPIDILKNKSDEIDLKSKYQRIKQQLIGFKNSLGIGDTDVIEAKNVLSIPAMHTLLLENLIQTDNLESKIQKLKVQKSALELKKEEAEGKRVLDFVQLKYADRASYSPGDQVSIGVGIVLPTGNQNRENVVEAAIDLYREERKLEAMNQSKQKTNNELQSNYLSRYNSYQYKKEEIDNLQLEKKLDALSKVDEIDAISLLDIKLFALKRQIDILDDEQFLRERYLEFVFKSGLYNNYDINHIITRK